ncbi:MAG: acyloxyacyl hydrolase [Mediterranea sp.]|jgi:hypothetical protein|nr:acyloxyacyl hydrolase [Mediterranea sp.]
MLAAFVLLSFCATFAQQGVLHKIGVEYRPEYIFQTSPFLRGINRKGGALEWGNSVHLKYAFQFKKETPYERIFKGVYQGVGISYSQFEDRQEIGAPWTLYLFQGGRIARFSRHLSLDYEWNFGVGVGWKPYNDPDNLNNKIIGSKANAYLNAGIQLHWEVRPQIDLVVGAGATHFSNGNTMFPNAGLNTTGLKVGVLYNFNRTDEEWGSSATEKEVPLFKRHINYDLTLFGSWRRAGVPWDNRLVAAPGSFAVFGFNFAPMYNFSYRFKAGLSLDGVYDGSTNIYAEDAIVGTEPSDLVISSPAFYKQLGLGISARGEYVMPYFTIGTGLGTNFLRSGRNMNGLYQVLYLKMALTRSTYLHIGYSLKNFHNPNYLMLGIGIRFNNKYPRLN